MEMKGSPQDTIASWTGEEETESHVEIDKDWMSQLPHDKYKGNRKVKGASSKGKYSFKLWEINWNSEFNFPYAEQKDIIGFGYLDFVCSWRGIETATSWLKSTAADHTLYGAPEWRQKSTSTSAHLSKTTVLQAINLEWKIGELQNEWLIKI